MANESEVGGAAIREIERIAREAELLKTAVVEIDGAKYSNRPLTRVDKPEFVPDPLDLTTLQGLVDFIRDKPDEEFLGGRKVFVHVAGPEEVLFVTGAGGPQMRRQTIARAEAEVPQIAYGQQMNIEGFVVLLRTCFLPTPSRDALVDLLSNIDATNAVTLTDDGLSQQCVVNRGVRGKIGVKLPNPCPLAPYRTFSAVTQPESPFLVRLHGGGEGRLPSVSIHEADLGQWKLAAIQNVKTFLVDALPGVAVYG